MFRVALVALALAVGATIAPRQPPRRPALKLPLSRRRAFSVTVVGSGPDVILIPALPARAAVWRGAVAANPGYRYHLVQVAGFAGAPTRGNARGPVVAPLAEEIYRYIAANRSSARAGRPFDGRHFGDDDRRPPSSRGRQGDGGSTCSRSPRPWSARPRAACGASPTCFASSAARRRPPSGRIGDRHVRSAGEGRKPSDPDVVGRAAHELL
jgi:hypothetical protein